MNNNKTHIIPPNFISVLSFEDLGIYSSTQARNNPDTNTIISYSLLSVESIILLICIYQLLRFFKHGKLYLKKVIHILILFSMTVCIVQGTNIPAIFEEMLREAYFVFCSLVYFAVLLFWVDFYQKLTQGRGLLFIQKRTFVVYMVVYVLLYMAGFIAAQLLVYGKETSILPSIAVWWHLVFYSALMLGMLSVTLLIGGTIKSMFLNVRVRFFRKTAKMLAVVCACYIIRFIGTLSFVLIHYKPSMLPTLWDSPEGFAIIYVFDRIVPVIVFLVVMRKIPSPSSSSESLARFYTPLLNDA